MNSFKKKNVFSIISAIVGVVMLISIKFIVPVCSGMVEMASGTQTFMKCHYTSVAIGFLSIILIVNSIAALITGQTAATGIVAIVVSILIFLVFDDGIGIGICARSEMACHVTAPVIKLYAALEILSGAAMLITSRKEKNKG